MSRLSLSRHAGLMLFVLAGVGAHAEPMAIVSHLTRVKIVESNMVSVRPGSVYENRTYFESLFDFPNPGFNYRFVDTGLGTAEPLYPIYQKGHQGSWLQLIFAMFGEGVSRHIDHYTSLPTIEGCQVDSIYMLRNINEFPKNLYQRERAEGFKQIVIRLEHYTKLHSLAQCGRHRSHLPDPQFNPKKFLKRYTHAKTLADFPAADLARFEAHIAAIRHIREEFSRTLWPKFDLSDLKNNSLWYYPEGFDEDYGINTSHRLAGFDNLRSARHLVYAATDQLRSEVSLARLLPQESFYQLLDFINGKPTPDYDSTVEPGADVSRLSDVTPRHVYTQGLKSIPIQNVFEDVSDSSHFGLVGLSLQPAVVQEDVHFDGQKVVPQIRFVFQMLDPQDLKNHYEQLYFHLNFDAVDRYADLTTQQVQQAYFLSRIDELAAAKDSGRYDEAESLLRDLIRDFTQRPVQEVSFSSSLSGMWIFGALSRNYNVERALRPVRIIRNGVDVGYYSSVNDNTLFRNAHKVATGEYKETLAEQLEDLWIDFYRDPKRLNVEKVNFQRMTCAQCHHLSGRDAVHMALNDGLDSRIRYPMRATEFVYREADRQLRELSISRPSN